MGSEGPTIRLADTEIGVLNKDYHQVNPIGLDWTGLSWNGLGLDLTTKRESGHDTGVRIPSICFINFLLLTLTEAKASLLYVYSRCHTHNSCRQKETKKIDAAAFTTALFSPLLPFCSSICLV